MKSGQSDTLLNIKPEFKDEMKELGNEDGNAEKIKLSTLAFENSESEDEMIEGINCPVKIIRAQDYRDILLQNVKKLPNNINGITKYRLKYDHAKPSKCLKNGRPWKPYFNSRSDSSFIGIRRIKL